MAAGGAVEVKRAVRVAEEVREEIATALKRDLGDPRLEMVVITRVQMPDDLSTARVMFRLAADAEDAAARKRATAGLERAAGMLRKLIGKRLHLRRSPELKFFYDQGIDASGRVGDLLAEIARERKPPEE